jgi:hypothetical protein
LVEVDYFLRENRPAMRQLVDELVDPTTTLDLEPTTEHDVLRALGLDQKFRELQIGLVDGVVVERLRIYRILTIDHEDFEPLRVGHRFTQRLELIP